MRVVVVILALLAGLKLAHQEYLFRSATNEVIVSAYKDRAIQACQKDPKALTLAGSLAAWARPAAVRLAIGKSNLDVHFWQVNHAMWNARFKNPYLFVVADQQPANVFCEFDIVNGIASVHRL